MTMTSWTKNFLKAQGHETETKLMQDNTSATQMERNGKASAHKRTRHINIRCFFIKDQIDRGVAQVECCPTDSMKADFFSKAQQGELFNRMRADVMGMGMQTDSGERVSGKEQAKDLKIRNASGALKLASERSLIKQ